MDPSVAARDARHCIAGLRPCLSATRQPAGRQRVAGVTLGGDDHLHRGRRAQFSTIEVQNAQGVRVDKADPHLVDGDQTKLAVSLPKLPAGEYTVIWHATSVDTHKTEGRFNFSVTP